MSSLTLWMCYLRLIRFHLNFLIASCALVWDSCFEAEEHNQGQESHSSKHLRHNHVQMWIRKHDCSGCATQILKLSNCGRKTENRRFQTETQRTVMAAGRRKSTEGLLGD